MSNAENIVESTPAANTASIKITQFLDIAKKPEAPADSNLRAVYLLARAGTNKDGSTKEKIHHAVFVPMIDASYVFTAEQIAIQKPEITKAITNMLQTSQDELVKDAVLEAISSGKYELNAAVGTFDCLIYSLSSDSQRGSNRLKRDDIISWFDSIVAPQVTLALVAKGADEARIELVLNTFSAWFGKLAAVSPALTEQQIDQLNKTLALPVVAESELTKVLRDKITAIGMKQAELVDLL